MTSKVDFWILMLLIVAMAIGFGYKLGKQSEKLAWCESELIDIRRDFYGPINKK